MAQIRGPSGYSLGGQSNFGQPQFGAPNMNNNPATNDPSPLDAIREQTSKIEDFLDTVSEPLKP